MSSSAMSAPGRFPSLAYSLKQNGKLLARQPRKARAANTQTLRHSFVRTKRKKGKKLWNNDQDNNRGIHIQCIHARAPFYQHVRFLFSFSCVYIRCWRVLLVFHSGYRVCAADTAIVYSVHDKVNLDNASGSLLNR